MDEYTGRTTMYVQRTNQIACTLSAQLCMPCLLSQEGFGFWASCWAFFLGLDVGFLNGPSMHKCLGVEILVGL